MDERAARMDGENLSFNVIFTLFIDKLLHMNYYLCAGTHGVDIPFSYDYEWELPCLVRSPMLLFGCLILGMKRKMLLRRNVLLFCSQGSRHLRKL